MGDGCQIDLRGWRYGVDPGVRYYSLLFSSFLDDVLMLEICPLYDDRPSESVSVTLRDVQLSYQPCTKCAVSFVLQHLTAPWPVGSCGAICLAIDLCR